LVDAGHAYPCFCTPERLGSLREEQIAAKASFVGYDRHCRDLDPAEAKARVEAGEPHVIRLKMPTEGTFGYKDRLRKDEFTKSWAELDDQVLVKGDGWPTYHLAAVVDDHLMGITHVIRAEEWLNSLPKHALLFERFGWQAPEFVHVGLLRNSDRSKISKRKNPTDLLWYKKRGYLPEALLNFLATLGHSHPDERELFDREELLRIFDLDRLNVSGPVFDMAKLTHLQGQWLRLLDDQALRDEIHRCLDERLTELLPLLRERLTFGGDATFLSDFFFREVVTPHRDDLVPKGWDAAQAKTACDTTLKAIKKAAKGRDWDWSVATVEELVRGIAAAQEWKPKQYFMTLRVAVAGRKEAPPLFDTLALLGQSAVMARLEAAALSLR
jgi:glutamyl-tRNA synthetase